MAKRTLYYLLAILITTLGSCTSYEQFRYITEEFEIPTRVYRATYAQAWQAVIEIMKKYDLPTSDQQSGIIKTAWIDNTLELNFADSFDKSDMVKAAKFKIIVNVIKGYRGGGEVSKVTIFKRQLVEPDFLQGWKEIPSDGIMEQTLLYRLEMVLKRDKKLRQIEEMKAKEIESELES